VSWDLLTTTLTIRIKIRREEDSVSRIDKQLPEEDSDANCWIVKQCLKNV